MRIFEIKRNEVVKHFDFQTITWTLICNLVCTVSADLCGTVVKGTLIYSTQFKNITITP